MSMRKQNKKQLKYNKKSNKKATQIKRLIHVKLC